MTITALSLADCSGGDASMPASGRAGASAFGGNISASSFSSDTEAITYTLDQGIRESDK